MELPGRLPAKATAGAVPILLLFSLLVVAELPAPTTATSQPVCSPNSRPGDFSALRANAILIVRVVSGGGDPVQGAVVHVTGNGVDATQPTDATGYAYFTLPKATFEVSVTYNGQEVYYASVDVHGAKRLDVVVGGGPPPPPPPPPPNNNTTNQPPHACFTYSPTEPQAEEPVTFDATSSLDPEGSNLTYRWDFGDGTPTATDAVVNHTFEPDGNYTVRINVTDDQGASAEADTTLFVLPAHPQGTAPRMWNLTIEVRYTNGTPASEAQAQVYDANGSLVAQVTLTQGVVVQPLPEGDYTVHAAGQGKNLGTQPVALDVDREVVFLLDQNPSNLKTFTIHVRFPDGSPVAGAKVEVLNYTLATVYRNTSATGDHVILLPAGNYTAEAWGKDRHFLGAQTVILDGDREITFTETLGSSPSPWLRLGPAVWGVAGVSLLGVVGGAIFLYSRHRLGP